MRAQALRRLTRLRSIAGIKVFDDNPSRQGTWPFLLLLLPDQVRRDAALAPLWSAGLGVSRLFIHALPDYAYLAPIVPPQDLPHARDFAARRLSISISISVNVSVSVSNSLWMTDEDSETICHKLEGSLG